MSSALAPSMLSGPITSSPHTPRLSRRPLLRSGLRSFSTSLSESVASLARIEIPSPGNRLDRRFDELALSLRRRERTDPTPRLVVTPSNELSSVCGELEHVVESL